jgi:hypothetical protein
MDRAELEQLDRESLVLRAQAAGVRRARLLTRPELVDELLRLDPSVDAAQLKRTRGFFGRARDLLSRVVERGLHLPDAADRLRAALGSPLPQVPRPEPQAVPTVTLAEIYAAQGHRQRAVDTLKRVLEAEPDHGAARSLLEKLQAEDYVAPPPPLPPEADEARDEIGGNLGNGASALPASARHDPSDECIAIPVGKTSSYVWWRLSALSRERLAAEPSSFCVRAVILVPTWDGPVQETRDVPCDPNAGEATLRGIPEGAVVRVAIGLRDQGAFVPFSHSLPLERMGSSRLVRWTLEGATPVPLDDPKSASIARALARASEPRT